MDCNLSISKKVFEEKENFLLFSSRTNFKTPPDSIDEGKKTSFIEIKEKRINRKK